VGTLAKLSTWKMLYPTFKAKNSGDGAYENMQDDFLMRLYRFRIAMDNPMIVHAGYATAGHSPNSFHYQGRAIDFHFRYNPVPTRKIIVTAIKCGLHGIGFYPFWSPYPGGMHIDNRSAGIFNVWSRNKNGIYTYTFPNKIPESLEEWQNTGEKA
jgi:uncharacterized protein YcbK (DUF882 family)